MHVNIYRKSGHVLDGIVPNQWPDFWLLLSIGFICLLIASKLAKVRIGSFPLNPLYWHYWVIVNAEKSPWIGDKQFPGVYRPYMLFWAASALLQIYSLLILVSICFK